MSGKVGGIATKTKIKNEVANGFGAGEGSTPSDFKK